MPIHNNPEKPHIEVEKVELETPHSSPPPSVRPLADGFRYGLGMLFALVKVESRDPRVRVGGMRGEPGPKTRRRRERE